VREEEFHVLNREQSRLSKKEEWEKKITPTQAFVL